MLLQKREKDLIDKLGLTFASPDLQAQIAADAANQNADNGDGETKPKTEAKKK
jgi:hypothetical protein